MPERRMQTLASVLNPRMLSTMSHLAVDTGAHTRIAEFGLRVLRGGQITSAEAMDLLELTSTADIYDLMAWANRIREHYKGNKIHLCSVANIKAGGCPENCRFCAQSARHQTDAPRYGLVPTRDLLAAAEEAGRHGAASFDLVAAWRELEEGPVLDDICERIEALKRLGKAQPDASLGIIKNPRVAARLKAAGCDSYNHNLETSRRFFPHVCDSHTYDDRVETIRHLKNAGIRICSGGIIGMGENLQDRCDLAFSLKELGVSIVPINLLNPIAGTPFGGRRPLAPLQALQTIACFRFILPTQEIMLAGGRAVNLRDLQSMVFMAGASALMIGNYLTTLNQPPEKDLQMLRDLGLAPRPHL